ncbi:major facilitator superfamily domain-containing protein [Podospora appendiculata]|uniref:Major facilitator superfamily domain-containing protein n=1 Tax=Podospora appendiculata TaxID=314037 RepID=A0AAE0WYE7_9PEZI|nr:major facilitator superfamily domain-containing protein [Podospora appendiculata]
MSSLTEPPATATPTEPKHSVDDAPHANERHSSSIADPEKTGSEEATVLSPPLHPDGHERCRHRALIPYIETYYNISYTVVSLVFLSPFVGYLLAALTNNLPLCRLAGYIPIALHPPYAALPVVMLLVGFGNGLEDSAWNAWIGNMHQANELLGLLHGAYGLGATIGPLIATAMVTKAGLPWYTFYYVMIGVAAGEFLLTTTAFWGATGAVYRAKHMAANGGKRTTTRHVLREPITWLMALFLLGYVGAEVSLGGWIVTFMLRVRNAEPFMAGLIVTFFWLGLTVGRVVLGFVTGRIGEKLAITVYLLLSVALELLYWLRQPAVARRLPCVGDWVCRGVGGGGAAIFPFAVGAIAQSKGVMVLQPIVLAILVFILLMWWCLPGGMRRGGLERARENNEEVVYRVKQGFRWVKEKVGKSD